MVWSNCSIVLSCKDYYYFPRKLVVPHKPLNLKNKNKIFLNQTCYTFAFLIYTFITAYNLAIEAIFCKRSIACFNFTMLTMKKVIARHIKCSGVALLCHIQIVIISRINSLCRINRLIKKKIQSNFLYICFLIFYFHYCLKLEY